MNSAPPETSFNSPALIVADWKTDPYLFETSTKPPVFVILSDNSNSGDLTDALKPGL